jgi:small subunit ribosomal protein S9
MSDELTKNGENIEPQPTPTHYEEPSEVKVSPSVQYFYATGRRKEAVARVWLIPGGSGNVVVNEKPILQYLCRYSLMHRALEPLFITQTSNLFDVKATAKGGGLSGQADALRHGIARALVTYDPSLRPILRQAGMLTRDPRVKERKKYGRKRARRGFQFRKR